MLKTKTRGFRAVLETQYPGDSATFAPGGSIGLLMYLAASHVASRGSGKTLYSLCSLPLKSTGGWWHLWAKLRRCQSYLLYIPVIACDAITWSSACAATTVPAATALHETAAKMSKASAEANTAAPSAPSPNTGHDYILPARPERAGAQEGRRGQVPDPQA